MNDLLEQVTGQPSKSKPADTIFAELRDYRQMLAEQVKAAWQIMDGVDHTLAALARDGEQVEHGPTPVDRPEPEPEPEAERMESAAPKRQRRRAQDVPTDENSVSAVLGRLGAEPRGAWASAERVVNEAVPRMGRVRREALIEHMVTAGRIEQTTMEGVLFVRVPEEGTRKL